MSLAVQKVSDFSVFHFQIRNTYYVLYSIVCVCVCVYVCVCMRACMHAFCYNPKARIIPITTHKQIEG